MSAKPKWPEGRTVQPGPLARLLLWLADRRDRQLKREAEKAVAAHADYRPLLEIPHCPDCRQPIPTSTGREITGYLCPRHARQLRHRTQELQSLARAFQNS